MPAAVVEYSKEEECTARSVNLTLILFGELYVSHILKGIFLSAPLNLAITFEL